VLRTNLSTRPFYNERAIHAIAALIGLLVVAMLAWQGVRIVKLSRYKTELNTAIGKHRAETDVREREAAQIRRGLDQKELTVVATHAKEANGLIDQRTFSWTELFNLLESTLPNDVMLVAIRPEFKDNVTTLNLEVQGKSSDDIQAFWDQLEKTGAFHDVTWTAVNETDNGLDKMEMRAVYTQAEGAAKPPEGAAKPPAVKR
jgi:Tfp pilus assembly protein PilN